MQIINVLIAKSFMQSSLVLKTQTRVVISVKNSPASEHVRRILRHRRLCTDTSPALPLLQTYFQLWTHYMNPCLYTNIHYRESPICFATLQISWNLLLGGGMVFDQWQHDSGQLVYRWSVRLRRRGKRESGDGMPLWLAGQ